MLYIQKGIKTCNQSLGVSETNDVPLGGNFQSALDEARIARVVIFTFSSVELKISL